MKVCQLFSRDTPSDYNTGALDNGIISCAPRNHIFLFFNTPKSSILGRRTGLIQYFPKFCAFIWYYTQVCGRSFQKAITTHHRLRGISSYWVVEQTEAVALFRLPIPHPWHISLTWDSKHIHSSKNSIDFALKNKYTSIFVYICSKS